MSRLDGCRCAGWWLLAALALCGGCSQPGSGPVSGKVTLGGKPVTNGAITFHGAEGQTARGKIIDGAYLVEKPPFGECKVTILTVPPPPPGTGIDPDPKTLKPPDYLEVPERYGRPQTSPLTVEVTREPQTKDFPLEP
jgi:hypothetical protein